MSLKSKRSMRHLGVVLFYAIVLWWAYDHLLPYVPEETYDYLPDIDDYIPRIEFELPKLELDYHRPLYNESKVALLIENRAIPNLAPLMLHMMSVVPPDWRFQFMGSNESVAFLNHSAAIKRQVDIGRLDLTYIPSNMSVAGQEMISRFLTDLYLYEHVLKPAEWLLIFQSDSENPLLYDDTVLTSEGILCANSLDSLDNYLEYDWVGAPWYEGSRYGGNGGLSLRRVSSIVTILQRQKRQFNSEPEDVWLTERLGHLPQYRTANGSVSHFFSGEMRWVDEPMGYHIGGSGAILNGGLWGTPEKRKKIFDYCPEVKLTLDMDTEAMMGNKFCNENF